MSNQTIGHCANSMGVRGHSAGTIFPAVIMMKGSFVEGFTFHVLNHPFVPSDIGWNRYNIAEEQAFFTPRHF
jgi:hypothetical protein